uniref:Uncharacterized protein n=1 Tax=Sphenodon punctatus TaxID=8508 RepID=A0A8D0HHS9_SPHPU
MGAPSSTALWVQYLLSVLLCRWVFIYRKGYQESDTDPHVSVITKLKGISVTHIKEFGERLWDVADYVKPPQVYSVPAAQQIFPHTLLFYCF